MTKNTTFLKIDLISEDGADNRFENDWQTECKDLNQLLSDQISDYSAKIEAKPYLPEAKEGEQARAGELFDFTSLMLSLTSPEMLIAIGGTCWETLSKWLESRKSCNCVINIDGSEYHFNNLTKDQLIEIMSKQTRKA